MQVLEHGYGDSHGTIAMISADSFRRLPEDKIGMIVDRGHDWPQDIQNQLEAYGQDMWLFRDDKTRATTRARNTYQKDLRGCVVVDFLMIDPPTQPEGDTHRFQYLNHRLRITPRDLINTKLERPTTLHFICSPSRAKAIISEVDEIQDWNPINVYEPIPVRAVC